MNKSLINAGVKVINAIDNRQLEYTVAESFLSGCTKILDAGCGRGAFLVRNKNTATGIDLNPDNVSFCKANGLDAKVGNVLEIPFEDNSFDGAFCSHVIQIFDYQNAMKLLSELNRVVKPGGKIVIATFPDHKRLYFTPETYRAYPPQAIRNLIKSEESIHASFAPTVSSNIRLKQGNIWLRRPALVEFEGPRNEYTNGLAVLLNAIQCKIGLKKYWDYNGFLIQLISHK